MPHLMFRIAIHPRIQRCEGSALRWRLWPAQGTRRSFSSCASRSSENRDSASDPETTLAKSTAGNREPSVLAFLERRGLINQIAGDRDLLDKLLRTRKLGFYSGVDPTAPSLHLGHLLPWMLLFWMYRYGHPVISLIGGATVLVGDPTDRLTSRDKMDQSVRIKNVESITAQVKTLWENAEALDAKMGGVKESGSRTILNNSEWLSGLTLMSFLKELGSGVRLGAMLSRDTVRNKMEKGDGMSFAELTYPLLQAWDWCTMYKESGVQLQIGGSDQYGNIVAGIDAIKYMAHNSTLQGWSTFTDEDGKLLDDMAPMGMTVPLLTTSSGVKFGKSAGNAVWLDRNLTSPFDLYGFLLRTSDDDIERYLKMFTILPDDDISRVMRKHGDDPGQRLAQHLLATEVLKLVHGESAAQQTKQQHRASRQPTLATLGKDSSASASNHSDDQASRTSDTRMILPRSLVLGRSLAVVIHNAGMAASKSAASRLIESGGLYVATRQGPEKANLSNQDEAGLKFVALSDQQPSNVGQFLLLDKYLILRQGKWKTRTIEIVADGDYQQEVEAGRIDPVPAWLKLQSMGS